MSLLENLGGRSYDDLLQFIFSIGTHIKNTYPMNEVPEELELNYKFIVNEVSKITGVVEVFISEVEKELQNDSRT